MLLFFAFLGQEVLTIFGLSIYAFEIAGLVREGHMTRNAGLAKLSAPWNEALVRSVEAKLLSKAGE